MDAPAIQTKAVKLRVFFVHVDPDNIRSHAKEMTITGTPTRVLATVAAAWTPF
tara:strand:+ start:10518 stop:10676 length:159 start_codon:yes stop_codon:yes gene_type:complete